MESVCQKGNVYGDLVFGQESLANPEHEAQSMISGNESDRFIEGSHNRGNGTNRISIREALNVGLPNGKLIDEELRTKFSSPFSESDCHNSTLINMKLQGQEHHPCSKVKSFRRSGVSSSESSAPIKRSRSAGLNPQTLFCQVFGCSKDLSSSKDYHKRHKVCDSHSKTAKVIVNRIEQRFCQQCSRFHLLGEFDEGKHSCRKRLAVHNERRRKPNMRYHFGRNQRVQSFNDAMLNGISSDKTSSISKELIPTDPLHFEKIGAKGWNHPIKAEFEDDCCKVFATPPDNYNLPTGDHLLIISSGNQYSGAYENQANVLSGSVINNGGDNHSQDIPELMCTDSSYAFTTTGIQNPNVFCSEPNFNGFSTTTSASALSFLSSQSQNSPSYSTGNHRSQTWSITGNPSHCNVSQVCDTLPEAFPVPLVNGVSHKLAACHLNPEIGDLHPMQIPENSVDVNFGDSGFFEGLRYDIRAACEAGLTIDLLHLSTHLQQVDCQNQSTYVLPLPDMCNTSSSEFHSASITSNGRYFCCLREFEEKK